MRDLAKMRQGKGASTLAHNQDYIKLNDLIEDRHQPSPGTGSITQYGFHRNRRMELQGSRKAQSLMTNYKTCHPKVVANHTVELLQDAPQAADMSSLYVPARYTSGGAKEFVPEYDVQGAKSFRNWTVDVNQKSTALQRLQAKRYTVLNDQINFTKSLQRISLIPTQVPKARS
jgi:hypothetical protein